MPALLLGVLVRVLGHPLVQPGGRPRDHACLAQQPRHRLRGLRPHRQPVPAAVARGRVAAGGQRVGGRWTQWMGQRQRWAHQRPLAVGSRWEKRVLPKRHGRHSMRARPHCSQCRTQLAAPATVACCAPQPHPPPLGPSAHSLYPLNVQAKLLVAILACKQQKFCVEKAVVR